MISRTTYVFMVSAMLALLVVAACRPVAAPATQPPAEPVATADPTTADPAEAEMLRAMAAALTETPWQWTQFTGADEVLSVQPAEPYTVSFSADGTLEVVADCQRVAGTYTVAGGVLAIKLGAGFSNVAADACAQDSHSTRFLQLLSNAGEFFAMGGALKIALKADGGTLSFAADPTTVVDLCGEKATALNPIESTLPPAMTDELDRRLAAFLTSAAHPAPGAAMLVITPAGRYFKAAGVADVTTCVPLAADAPFEIGSSTKLMTSAMILQLQEEGALSIDDPIAKWVPGSAATLPNGDSITIDMLLRHTSGLYDYFDVDGEGRPIATGTEDKAMLTRAFTPVELVERVAAASKSYFAPDEAGQFHYSNTGYILLGLIVEAVTGKSYAENLQERIVAPLGLTKTFLLEGQPAAGLLPQAYYSTPFTYTTGEWNASQAWSAGAVVSTAEEFAVFLKALFTGRLFQDASTLDLMRGHSAAGSDALGPGMNYGRGMLDNNGVLGHGGQTLGFQSDGGYIPAEDLTIVMWSNSATSDVTRYAVPALVETILAPAGADGSPAPAGESPTGSTSTLPGYVSDLEAAYGPPSQAAFGSAVFFDQMKATDSLEQMALEKYKYFAGDLWERYGEDAWLGPWKEVYARAAGAKPDIAAELRSIDDRDAASSVPMILDNVEGADRARAALSAAYDDPDVTELRVFNLGDGEAMSGLLVAGRRTEAGEATFLVFLLD